VRGVLHYETGLAVEPARLHANPGGNGVDAAEPAVGEGAVAVEGLALPKGALHVGLEPRVIAVGIQDGAAGRAAGTATDGALAEKGLPATWRPLGERRGRGTGEGRRHEREGHDGCEKRFHARL